MKKNCWEFKRCGMEKKRNRNTSGNCPVPTMSLYDGVHDGKNGGRVCWMIAGSACQEDVQGTFAQKLETCSDCDFYESVQVAEGKNLKLSLDVIEGILSRIK
jgi:hypothetical protein